MNSYYHLGCLRALLKLGMDVMFNSPQEAAQHASRKDTLNTATGLVGNVAGGAVGGTLGAVGGPAGSLAGSVAGGYVGDKLLSGIAGTAYDAQKDMRNRAMLTRDTSLAHMNAAAGLPTGRRVV